MLVPVRKATDGVADFCWQQAHIQRAPQVDGEEKEDGIGPLPYKEECVAYLLCAVAPGRIGSFSLILTLMICVN